MSAHLVIVAAGSGSRLQRGRPKALVELFGRPILSWALDRSAHAAFSRTVVAGPPEALDEVRRLTPPEADVVAGGATRSESVRLGVAALAPSDDDLVCIHDAARPLVEAADLRAVVAAARESGAAIAAMPIADTVKKAEGFRIVETLDRSALWAAATPQVFRADWLVAALEGGREATDESELVESAGHAVVVVPVSRLAFKITTPEDLALAEAWLARRPT